MLGSSSTCFWKLVPTGGGEEVSEVILIVRLTRVWWNRNHFIPRHALRDVWNVIPSILLSPHESFKLIERPRGAAGSWIQPHISTVQSSSLRFVYCMCAVFPCVKGGFLWVLWFPPFYYLPHAEKKKQLQCLICSNVCESELNSPVGVNTCWSHASGPGFLGRAPGPFSQHTGDDPFTHVNIGFFDKYEERCCSLFVRNRNWSQVVRTGRKIKICRRKLLCIKALNEPALLIVRHSPIHITRRKYLTSHAAPFAFSVGLQLPGP